MRRDADRILDEYLVASARSGDQAKFEHLAQRWAPKLLAHAYRLTGDVELARDIAQEGWCDIAKGLKRLNDTAAFPAWAYKIITRRSADAIRKLSRDRKGRESVASEPAEIDTSTHKMEAAADISPMKEALKHLSAEQRATIALHYQQDLSVSEIAVALSVPVGTVKTRLMHARRKLREILEGESNHD